MLRSHIDFFNDLVKKILQLLFYCFFLLFIFGIFWINNEGTTAQFYICVRVSIWSRWLITKIDVTSFFYILLLFFISSYMYFFLIRY